MSLNIPLLKLSFEAIQPIADQVLAQFYLNLHRNHPESKSIFPSSSQSPQHKTILTTLTYVMDHLDKPSDLKNYLNNLNIRYHKHKLVLNYFDWITQSTLETLAYVFDDTWSTELEQTWKEALLQIADGLQETPTMTDPKTEKSPSSIIEQIEMSVKEMMESSLSTLTGDASIQELARAKARILLQEAVEKELEDLRQRYHAKRAA